MGTLPPVFHHLASIRTLTFSWILRKDTLSLRVTVALRDQGLGEFGAICTSFSLLQDA